MIKETKDYILVVGDSVEDKSLCYKIINKETGVTEVETSILPQGYKYLMDLQAGLDAVKGMKEEMEPDLTNVTSIKPVH